MKPIQIGFLGLLTLFYPCANAALVTLTDATATYSQCDDFGSFPVSQAVDGVLTGSLPNANGWAIDGAYHWRTGPEAAVFHTAANANFNGHIAVRLVQDYWNYCAGHDLDTLGRFRISYTTANRNAFANGLAEGGDIGADSIWHTLSFSSFTDFYRDGTIDPGTTSTFLSDGSVLVGGNNHRGTYVLSSALSVQGVTGFRIDVLQDPSLPQGGPGREPWNGNFVLTEFQISTDNFDPLYLGAKDGSAPTVVPEPTTAAAGLLLLIPFGLHMVKGLRRKRT